MTSDTNTSSDPNAPHTGNARLRHVFRRGGPARKTALVIAILAVGAAGGAMVHRHIARAYPQSVMLLQPTPIAQVTKRGPVALKGQVGEIFGGKFILQDDSGHTLVDTGPRGDRRTSVKKDETVTVQGFFDRGLLHAVVLVHADGNAEGFGPPGPPRPGRGFGPAGFWPLGFGPGGHGPGGHGPAGFGPGGFGPPRGPAPVAAPPAPPAP